MVDAKLQVMPVAYIALLDARMKSIPRCLWILMAVQSYAQCRGHLLASVNEYVTLVDTSSHQRALTYNVTPSWSSLTTG